MVLIIKLHFLCDCLILDLRIAVRHLPLMDCVLALSSHHTDLIVHFIELFKSLLISFGLRVGLSLLLSYLGASKVARHSDLGRLWLSSIHSRSTECLSLTRSRLLSLYLTCLIPVEWNLWHTILCGLRIKRSLLLLLDHLDVW